MLGFLKRLFGSAQKARKRPDVALVRIIEGAVFDPVRITEMPATVTAPPPTIPSWDEPHAGMVDSPQTPGAYMVGLVGEQHYQAAVAALKPGAAICLELEPDNPQDSSAIAAVDGRGRVVGYIAPESWLREAVYGDGATFSAQVLAVELGSRGFREVVLEIAASEEQLRERHYQPMQPQLI
jgi:hypothetical protein